MELLPNKDIELPEPWYWTEDDLTKQLKKEIHYSHILYNKHIKTIARREDQDDVLFELEDKKFAVVHLTWRELPHANNMWPTTKMYNNWEDVYVNRILVDSEFYQ